jgi:elongation factor P
MRRSRTGGAHCVGYFSMATTSDLRNGIIIRWNNQLHRVVEFHHHAPGNWRAMVILKLKNMNTGKTIEERVRAGEDIEIVRVEKRDMQFLYRDGQTYHFMDNETYEQLEVAEDTIGDAAKFLKDTEMASILFYDENQILGVEVPVHVVLEVVEASIAVRGDTATNVLKQVTLETGAVIQVPAFVNQGDRVKVDTRSGQYIERM